MKRTRKGFTLIELLIVITIMAILSAAMAVSGSSANAAAKASTIYNNLNAIKTAAVIYQAQQGTSFKESNVTAANLKAADILDLDTYNNTKSTTKDDEPAQGQTEATTQTTTYTYDNIKYAVVAGEWDDTNKKNLGAYVICSFADDGDATNIAKALNGYKNIRIDDSAYTVGAFLYHSTPAKYETASAPAYDREFDYEFPTSVTEDKPTNP